MKAVKFLIPHSQGCLYREGEVAGFDDAVADDLIQREIAVEVAADAEPEPEPTPAPASTGKGAGKA